MNHYERLQVASDASLETILAAYRALAKRWQPECNDGSGAWLDREAERLAALTTLNEAFETLRDPEARLAYDHALRASQAPTAAQKDPSSRVTAPIAATTGPSDEPVKTAPAVSPVTEPASTMPAAPPEPRRRGPSPAVPRQWVLVGLGGALLLVAAVGFLVWQRGAQMDVDRAMSQQYQAGGTVSPSEPAGVGAALSSRPTVQELSRLSDEELLKALPKVGAAPAVAPAPLAAVGNRPHPLDGKPLGLRNESKVDDPLAPEPTPPSKASVKQAR